MNPSQRRQSVLVVDDDAIVRLMATEALSEAGYQVAEAADAEVAWDHFNRLGADLVLLDVILPGMNGFEACARLRRHPAGANVPIIVMTALDDRTSIARAYDSGATDFITKPIVWDLLPYRVRYALRASAAFGETLRSRALLSRSQSLAQMGSWEWRRQDDALECSDEMRDIVGTCATAHDKPAMATLLAQVHPEDCARVERALNGAMTQGLAYRIEFRVVRADGVTRRLLEQTHIERMPDDTVCAVHGIRRDITEQTEANERIRTLAYFDPLTGLANRVLFGNMVQQMLNQGRAQGTRCAVLIIDIDRFKLINETLGPRVGDEVLQAVGQRLRECLRAGDPKGSTRVPAAQENVARLGGDEFTVLLGDCTNPQQARLVAQRIQRALGEPLTVSGHEVNIAASIGISMTPDDGIDTDSLLRNASTAMHAAKADAQQHIRFYANAMSAAINHKVMIETELRRALQQGELRLHYQAKVDVRWMQVLGAEALLRWTHPTRGPISPAEFIPVAEASGLIVPITQWVITEVCCQLAAWRAQGLRTIAVSINLDAASLQSPATLNLVTAALAQHGLLPSAIEFEVTESSLMHDLDRVSQTLEALRDIGVKLSIDDFGTGYSSLTYLKRFPVNALKIDRSFVQGLPADKSDGALTTAIIAMGHSLGLELIAEGVETWSQVDFLAERRCFMVQGFLFARPLAPDEFAKLVQAGVTRAGRPGPDAGA